MGVPTTRDVSGESFEAAFSDARMASSLFLISAAVWMTREE